ncbi:hypothetical protein A0O28_0087210 [Trichoderma guizhouense]|uniref:Uncharacterized protein n=1 Tax=Trichoderma guizhouense TaxID=1491466 RepID=A0A1T3CQ17_9HYPO|nr:hypothetical protein A0O28_0087210 [Trichoderma guizhouense]
MSKSTSNNQSRNSPMRLDRGESDGLWRLQSLLVTLPLGGLDVVKQIQPCGIHLRHSHLIHAAKELSKPRKYIK